jgi:uracil-DNA glycosylase
MTTLSNRLERSWRRIIRNEFEIGGDFDYGAMEQFLQGEEDAGRPFYPKREEIFNALNLTPFEKVKVVIIGQDPYHGEGEAHGLCFSTKGSKIPPSLRNIYNEIDDEYRPVEIERHGDLTGWAKQGVLLLNATLTVQKDKAGSHRRKGKGWEKFTDAVIRAVNEKPGPVVFMLWGRDAQEVWDRCAQKEGAPIADRKNHLVLKASHPAPRSVHRSLRDGEIHSFLCCGHFQRANAHLKKHGIKRIDWQDLGKGRKAVGTSD